MSNRSPAQKLIEEFQVEDERSTLLVASLKDLIKRCEALDDAEMDYARAIVTVAAVARGAGVSRALISHEGCALPRTRDLIISVMKIHSENSLRAECEFLREEVKRLRLRLDAADSMLANRVVQLHRGGGGPKISAPGKKWSNGEVRSAVNIIPMDKI